MSAARAVAFVRRAARLVQIEHTLFALPILVAGVLLGAGGRPSLRVLGLAVVAGAGARTCALALNRILDRAVDALNPRTRARELPAGQLSVRAAWAIAAAGAAVFLAAAAALGPLCLALAPVPLLVFAVYPLMKRFTAACHFGVGFALALAPLGGFVAAAARLPLDRAPLLLALFTFLWVSGFDILYAVADEAFDRAHGVHALPARLGRHRARAVARALHAGAALVLGALVVPAGGLLAGAPLAAAAALLVLEHVRADDLHLSFFRANVGVGFAALAAVALAAGTAAPGGL
jgi:4-hydroxybenzoate polyprenyltransferase